MKSLLGRKLANSVSSVGSMVLFLIFASCSLIIIAAGASTYSRISDSVKNTFTSAAAVKYVTNKIRSGDKVVIEEEGKGIAVYTGDVVCVIMSDGPDIGERSGMANAYVDYVGGDIIFRNAHLLVEEAEDGLYHITVMAREEWSDAYCRVRGDSSEGA